MEEVALLLKQLVSSSRLLPDPGLQLEARVSSMACSTLYQLRLINLLQPFLAKYVLVIVIHALIKPCLDYCNTCYMRVPLKTVFSPKCNGDASILNWTQESYHSLLKYRYRLPIPFQAQLK